MGYILKDLDESLRFSPGQEQEFKMSCIYARKAKYNNLKIFEIENEEKEPGFPDTLEISANDPAALIEYKVTDESNNIKFQKAQPLFYRRNMDLCIKIFVWSVPEKVMYSFSAEEVIDAILRFGRRSGNSIIVTIRNGELR